MRQARAASKAERPVALISGGSRGLGSELVVSFLSRGYRVATMSRSSTSFIEEMQNKSRRARSFLWGAVDAGDFDSVRRFVNLVVKHFGRVDVLVNNAGTAKEGILATMPAQEIETCININLTGTMILTQACSRVMLRQASGCIINMSSVNAIRGHAGVSVYSATKAALDAMTRSLARELGPRNIRVNSIAPGYFESRMSQGISETEKQRIVRRTPLGRLARTEDIANAVHFLASEHAAFVTGQTIVIDGGLTC